MYIEYVSGRLCILAMLFPYLSNLTVTLRQKNAYLEGWRGELERVWEWAKEGHLFDILRGSNEQPWHQHSISAPLLRPLIQRVHLWSVYIRCVCVCLRFVWSGEHSLPFAVKSEHVSAVWQSLFKCHSQYCTAGTFANRIRNCWSCDYTYVISALLAVHL